ncbi:MAG: mechanosensitive ion channel protein MscS [Desulfovibrio sp.]|nr:MAG: mechanosensitive ion channel protein MscS [Desulfovibrio sp.]
MTVDYSLLFYLVGITLVAGVFYSWLSFRLSRFKQERVTRIEELVKDPETIAPMPTNILTSKEEKRKKGRIIKGVRSRFTIIQRVLFFLVAVFWFLAFVAPFIGKLPSTMLSILVAVLTAVIGIAAKPLVENMISGVVISFSNQLRVGDTLIIDQQYGTVEDISITHTKIKTWDWKRYVIPNSRMLTKEFTNLNLNDSRLWAYLEFYVSYDAEIERVRELAVQAAMLSDSYTDGEKPQFWVIRLEKECVVCWIAAWAESPAEAWNLKSDMAVNLTNLFQKEGIATHVSRVDLGARGSGIRPDND